MECTPEQEPVRYSGGGRSEDSIPPDIANAVTEITLVTAFFSNKWTIFLIRNRKCEVEADVAIIITHTVVTLVQLQYSGANSKANTGTL